jgi:hypothetical protein
MASMNYVGLSQDGDQWKALVNAEMNLQAHKMVGKFRIIHN